MSDALERAREVVHGKGARDCGRLWDDSEQPPCPDCSALAAHARSEVVLELRRLAAGIADLRATANPMALPDLATTEERLSARAAELEAEGE